MSVERITMNCIVYTLINFPLFGLCINLSSGYMIFNIVRTCETYVVGNLDLLSCALALQWYTYCLACFYLGWSQIYSYVHLFHWVFDGLNVDREEQEQVLAPICLKSLVGTLILCVANWSSHLIPWIAGFIDNPVAQTLHESFSWDSQPSPQLQPLHAIFSLFLGMYWVIYPCLFYIMCNLIVFKQKHISRHIYEHIHSPGHADEQVLTMVHVDILSEMRWLESAIGKINNMFSTWMTFFFAVHIFAIIGWLIQVNKMKFYRCDNSIIIANLLTFRISFDLC